MKKYPIDSCTNYLNFRGGQCYRVGEYPRREQISMIFGDNIVCVGQIPTQLSFLCTGHFPHFIHFISDGASEALDEVLQKRQQDCR